MDRFLVSLTIPQVSRVYPGDPTLPYPFTDGVRYVGYPSVGLVSIPGSPRNRPQFFDFTKRNIHFDNINCGLWLLVLLFDCDNSSDLLLFAPREY